LGFSKSTDCLEAFDVALDVPDLPSIKTVAHKRGYVNEKHNIGYTGISKKGQEDSIDDEEHVSEFVCIE
jgi:hypothetical protein